MRDHLVELRLSEATGVDVDAHRDALNHALSAAFIDGCATTLTVQQARCASRAPSLAAAAQCSAPGESVASH